MAQTFKINDRGEVHQTYISAWRFGPGFTSENSVPAKIVYLGKQFYLFLFTYINRTRKSKKAHDKNFPRNPYRPVALRASLSEF
jgi:hypothetical protein